MGMASQLCFTLFHSPLVSSHNLTIGEAHGQLPFSGEVLVRNKILQPPAPSGSLEITPSWQL